MVAAFYRKTWGVTYLLLMVSMVIDIDHLLATPIYDPNRCSVGFHPLHTLFPIIFYALMLIPKKTRIVGMGLCIHILLDAIDCQFTNGIWYTGL